MALNQGKYKPSVCDIHEDDDHKYGKNSMHSSDSDGHLHQASKQLIEGSETAPLTTNQQRLHIDETITTKDSKAASKVLAASDGIAAQNIDKALSDNSGVRSSVNGLRGRRSIDALMQLSRKRRILYVTTACLCALLLIIIIMLLAFWPHVPFYMRAPICLERECVQSSQQLLLWANTTKSPCHDSYNWACGNFARDFGYNQYFVIKRGEWNFKTYNEYQELNELNRLISMLPTTGGSYSVESMVSSLYRSCREIDMLDKSQSDLLLKKAIKSVDGWLVFRGSTRLQYWEYKKALVTLHVLYGIFPYYKVSVGNRFNKPHDYIIMLDVGELGLPDRYFYNTGIEDEVVRSYRLLLRDFAINMGVVSSEAELFADEIYHYEKRIAQHVDTVRLGNRQRELNKIVSLAELKSIAPSLPIAETLLALFPHTKISDETEVLVSDVEVLSQLSTVVSTSDKKSMNNFIIWSLARHLLPHISKEYRNLVDNFNFAIYGRTATNPRWMTCARIVRDWLPFAVDALKQQQQPTHSSQADFRRVHLPHATDEGLNKSQGNDEFMRLMFYSLRNELQASLEQADWIDMPLKQYINEKLIAIRLQFGIPSEVIDDGNYIKDYYNDLLLNNLYFVEHLESIWSFRKSRMEKKLASLSLVDTIISEMYSQEIPQLISYSNVLNMVIISRSVVSSDYYDYRYPIALNFARIGTDILETLIDNLSVFVNQYNAESAALGVGRQATDLKYEQPDLTCLTGGEASYDEELRILSDEALKSFHTTLSAVKVSSRALNSFLTAIDSVSPIIGATVNQAVTYDSLRLTERSRLPGLRSYNENELFTLAYMQKHCSTLLADKDYARIKPHVENQLAERYLFNATWQQIQFLSPGSFCSVSNVRCSNVI